MIYFFDYNLIIAGIRENFCDILNEDYLRYSCDEMIYNIKYKVLFNNSMVDIIKNNKIYNLDISTNNLNNLELAKLLKEKYPALNYKINETADDLSRLLGNMVL